MFQVSFVSLMSLSCEYLVSSLKCQPSENSLYISRAFRVNMEFRLCTQSAGGIFDPSETRFAVFL